MATALATKALTPRIPLSLGDKVMQTFRFTTGAKEVATDEYISTMFDSISCIVGFLAKGPGTAAVAATNTGTFTGISTAADTVTVGDIIYTARAAPGTEAYTYDVGTTATDQAAALVDAINYGCVSCGQPTAYTISAHPDVVASNVLGVVTFTARRPGCSGNLLTTAESSDNYTQAAAVLSGGTGQDKGVRASTVYTAADVNVNAKYSKIGGYTYTSTTVPGATAFAVDVGADSVEAAQFLSEAINKDGSAGSFGTATPHAHPLVFAQWNPATSTIQIKARQFGAAGNNILTTEDETNCSFTGGAMTGGLGGISQPDVEFQLNARGTAVAEGTNVGDLGVTCSEAGWEIEVTIIGEATAG